MNRNAHSKSFVRHWDAIFEVARRVRVDRRPRPVAALLHVEARTLARRGVDRLDTAVRVFDPVITFSRE